MKPASTAQIEMIRRLQTRGIQEGWLSELDEDLERLDSVTASVLIDALKHKVPYAVRSYGNGQAMRIPKRGTSMSENFSWGNSGSVDIHLAGSEKKIGKNFEAVRKLAQSHLNKTAIELPVAAGTRVAFQGADLSSLMSYNDPPANGTLGTVVSVKSASGNVTSHEGLVFVQWDGPDGKFASVYANHLASTGEPAKIRRVASMGDLGDFLKVASDTLVHKSTQDLWSLAKSAEGDGFVVTRLFDDTGKPLKA